MIPNFDLKNKVAVITGGGGALGGCIAQSLSLSGLKIAILDLTSESANNTVEMIEEQGGDAIGFAANVLSEDSIENVSQEIIKKWGRVDILLNAAGGNMPGATIAVDQTIFDLSMDDFKKVTELNLNGSVIPSLIFGKIMADQKSGSIINYSSMSVDRVITRVVGYSASKAGIENFTRWMAVEMALKYGKGIRVNAIAPGFFVGNQNKKLLLNPDGSYTERGETIIRNTPMKRFGKAEELNGAIHFLCSDAAQFITGVVIPIDGGFSAFSGV
ncbi:MAG: D-mannonate oxidoreductase [Flavobacteriaceae bacterium TMED179]|nr:MAG: D-mannonate oxidoreductase [Flavobacteriaceae bacterium TMED179]|tara:strand:- start:5197 stop:6012 length:816 start_codon:yes stop_codon:yes gene_type:complete